MNSSGGDDQFQVGDAMGRASGSGGLLLFAAICWKLLPGHCSLLILLSAGIAWLGASGTLWVAWKYLRRTLKVGCYEQRRSR